MLKLIGAVLTAAFLVTTSAAPAAEKPKDPDIIHIGALFAMTGKTSYYGTVMSQGMKQAIDEINAKGGVDGIKLEADIEDHKGGVAKDGVDGFTRVRNLYNVQAVMTSFTPPTLAVAPIADEQKIFLINGGGVSNNLVGASKYLFHNRSLASDLGHAAVSHAHDLGLKKMAELAWNSDAGDNIVKTVDEVWKKDGGTVVASEKMDVGAANIDTQIAKIRAGNPDFVGLWLFSPDPGLAAKRMRDFGLKVPLIGVEYTADVQKLGGAALEGYEFTSDYFKPSPDEPWSADFAKGYKERYNADPDFYAANYYEGVYVIAESMKRARAKGGAIGTMATRSRRRCARTRPSSRSMAAAWSSRPTAWPRNAWRCSRSRTATKCSRNILKPSSRRCS